MFASCVQGFQPPPPNGMQYGRGMMGQPPRGFPPPQGFPGGPGMPPDLPILAKQRMQVKRRATTGDAAAADCDSEHGVFHVHEADHSGFGGQVQCLASLRGLYALTRAEQRAQVDLPGLADI